MDQEANGLPYSDPIQRLQEEHRRYAEKLETLLQKPYLSDEDRLEEVRLKKLKLHTKDQIMARRNGQTEAYRVVA